MDLKRKIQHRYFVLRQRFRIWWNTKNCAKGKHRVMNKVKVTYTQRKKEHTLFFHECAYCQSKKFNSDADKQLYLEIEKSFWKSRK